MAKKLDPMDLKQIIRLHLDGLSNREISRTLGISRNTINSYMHLFSACEKSLEELLELQVGELEELFSSKTTIDNERYKALMEYLEKEKLAVDHPGFTFQAHYFEYKSRVDNPYSYTQFLEHHHRKYSKLKGSMKLNHKAGHEMMIDFAGKHLHIVDKESGELVEVEVFVAILPFSQYTYVEACRSQKREDLINGTSFAAPHAAGVASLMLAYYQKNVPTPDSLLAPEDCEELMQRNTFDLTAPPNSPGYDDQTGWGRINAGELLDSIQYPKFLVKHYEFNASTSGAVQVGFFEQSCLEKSLFSLPVGKIFAHRFQVTASTTHTLPAGYNLITGWARGSASDIVGINSGGSGICLPTSCLACNYMPDAANPAIDTLSLTPTGVTMIGYVYELLDSTFTPVGWWPYDTSSIATFAYSLYLVDPTIGIEEEETEAAFNIYPNPSNNTVTIQLGTGMQGKTEIILTDLTGKLVKVIATGQNMVSGQTVNFTVSELAQGMYFVSLHNSEKQLTRKLLVNK